MRLFAQLTKVDVEKREVWGRATQEVPDKSNEIFDYESSVPFFRAWSADFEKVTDGKSLGNIRAMHGKVAAGKVIAIDFNDAEKAIDIGAKIVDDAEFAKVQEGVYTGFSIGGAYVKRWKDGDDPSLLRFTADPSEISIVDNPCVSTATFAMVKADGVIEATPFKAPAESEPAPVATAQADGEPAAAAAPAKVYKHLRKGMYSVSALAELLSTVAYIAIDADWERRVEQDASTVPADLRVWLQMGVELFKKMSAEEADELIASLFPAGADLGVLAMAAGGDLAKAGARHSKADTNMVQQIHDHAVGLGAGCGMDDDAAKAAKLAKAAKIEADVAELQKRADQIATLEKSVGDLTAERDTLAKRVETLEAEPAPAKGVVKVIDKAADDALVEKIIAAPVPDPKDPLAVMKAVHAAGGRLIAR